MIIGGLIAALALAFLLGLVVQTLWNNLMPDIFGLQEINYWQAVGLLILGHLLFGGGHSFRHSRTRRKRDAIHEKISKNFNESVEPTSQQV